MSRAAIALAAAMAAGCTSTGYREAPGEVRVTYGLGGFVEPILARYDRWDAEGRRIVIDGHVISADAFGAFGARNACYTDRAIFSPHAASHLGLVPDYEITKRLAARLPAELRDWFLADASRWDWIGFAMVDAAQLRTLWPEGACPAKPDAEGGQ